MMNRVQGRWIAFVFCLIAIATASAPAGDPFLISANTTSGTPETVNASGSSLPNLVGNFVKGQSQFSSFQNRDASASLTYGGLGNAVIVSKNASNTSATLTLPTIGFTKVFTGANEGDLEKQIRHFAERDGAKIYGEFIRSINQQTELGVTDGNPLAATALLADQAFFQFGLQSTPFTAGPTTANPLDQGATPNVQLNLNGGYAHTDTGSSYFVGGDFSFGFKFGDRVGVVLSTPFEYRNIQGGAAYMIGEEVSLPILLIKPSGNHSFGWLLTPTGIVGGAGSVDLASGGLFAGGAITSSLSYQIDSFVFTLADSYSYFHGFPISIGAYKFETNLDQELLKNGLKITKFFGDSLFIDASMTFTQFLQQADIRRYWSPAAGVGLRFSSRAGVRVGYACDFSKDFVVNGGTVEFYLNY
ncbi:MAG TPA: hypothetical protein VFC46_03905 [Humisphaera sp.]|nr:hypothetical protein [Humisphaera sp.]